MLILQQKDVYSVILTGCMSTEIILTNAHVRRDTGMRLSEIEMPKHKGLCVGVDVQGV